MDTHLRADGYSPGEKSALGGNPWLRLSCLLVDVYVMKADQVNPLAALMPGDLQQGFDTVKAGSIESTTIYSYPSPSRYFPPTLTCRRFQILMLEVITSSPTASGSPRGEPLSFLFKVATRGRQYRIDLPVATGENEGVVEHRCCLRRYAARLERVRGVVSTFLRRPGTSSVKPPLLLCRTGVPKQEYGHHDN